MGYVGACGWAGGASSVKLGDFGYKQNSFLAQQTVQCRKEPGRRQFLTSTVNPELPWHSEDKRVENTKRCTCDIK